MSQSNPIVLAAEDEETDRLILRLAFERAHVNCPLITVRDGQEVIDYLTGKPPYQERLLYPMPGLLLLDLKMPRLTGFDVLEWLALNRQFRNIPAIIFSSSSHESDIQKARLLGAKDYLVKTPSLSNLVSTINAVCNRWLACPSSGSGSNDVKNPIGQS